MAWDLIPRVLESSESNDWDDAKMEWQLDHVFYAPRQECLCGKFPIEKVCVMKNKYNASIINVGRCCVEKFREDVAKAYDVIMRVKKDETKSLSLDVVKSALAEGIIREKDYEFYEKIYRRRTRMTGAQWEYKIGLNKRIVKEYAK